MLSKEPFFDTRLSSWRALGVSRLAQLWDITMEWELLAEWILSQAGVDMQSDTLEFSDRKASNRWFFFKSMLILCCILFLVLNKLSILSKLVQKTRLLKRANPDLLYINTCNVNSFWYGSLMSERWDMFQNMRQRYPHTRENNLIFWFLLMELKNKISIVFIPCNVKLVKTFFQLTRKCFATIIIITIKFASLLKY